MKVKTKKNVIVMLALSLVCSVLAVFCVTPVQKAAAEGTFEMVEGAEIRAKDSTSDSGLRFKVKMDETTKAKVENGATLGFIVSYSENFTNEVVDDYINVSPKLSLEKTKVSADLIYSQDDAYYANLAIVNMSDEQLKQDWSAVAYILENGTYTYATGVQSRSVQLVASNIYFADVNGWNAVSATYAKMGTEEMPILLCSGDYDEINSYQTLIEMSRAESSTVHNYKYEMTEDVIAEETLADVIVNAEEYDVITPEGLVWDGFTGTNAYTYYRKTEIELDDEELAKTIHSAEYVADQSFNANGNGSVKLTIDNTNGAGRGGNMFYGINSRFSKQYYAGLKDKGYTHLTMRLMIPDLGKTLQDSRTLNFDTLNGIADPNAQVLLNNGEDWSTITSSTTMYFGWNMGKKMGAWLEISLPLSETYVGFDSLPLFRFNVFAEGKQFVVYLDDVYLTKSAGNKIADAEIVDGGSEYDVYTKLGMDATNAAYANENYTCNDKAVSLTDGKITLTEQGAYNFSFSAKNRFGLASASVLAYNAEQYLWKVGEDTELNNIYTTPLYTNNTSTPSETSTATLNYLADWGAARVLHSANMSYSDLYIKPTQPKSYYEGLKAVGFKYVTINFRFGGGSFRMGAGGAYGADAIHYNNLTTAGSGLVTVEKAEDGTLTETAFVTAGPYNNSGTGYTVSYNIDLFIKSYKAEGTKILRLFTIWGNGAVMGWYNFTSIQLTKDGQPIA